jgi:anti-anti-sigma factor
MMELKTEQIGSRLILHIDGRIDTLASQQFETEMVDLIEKGETDLIGDCTKLDYVSSSALRVFLLSLKSLKRKNGRFVLYGLQPPIREVFDISGFLDLFQIFDNRTEALGSSS